MITLPTLTRHLELLSPIASLTSSLSILRGTLMEYGEHGFPLLLFFSELLGDGSRQPEPKPAPP